MLYTHHARIQSNRGNNQCGWVFYGPSFKFSRRHEFLLPAFCFLATLKHVWACFVCSGVLRAEAKRKVEASLSLDWARWVKCTVMVTCLSASTSISTQYLWKYVQPSSRSRFWSPAVLQSWLKCKSDRALFFMNHRNVLQLNIFESVLFRTVMTWNGQFLIVTSMLKYTREIWERGQYVARKLLFHGSWLSSFSALIKLTTVHGSKERCTGSCQHLSSSHSIDTILPSEIICWQQSRSLAKLMASAKHTSSAQQVYLPHQYGYILEKKNQCIDSFGDCCCYLRMFFLDLWRRNRWRFS